MSDEAVTELLGRLSSGGVDAAWSDFLARYSGLIMHVIRRFEPDQDRATDCFMHVCGALSDDRFRRLRSFRRDGPAKFKTWLAAVTGNLCVDWRRKERGRTRPLQCTTRLSELEQQVHRCIYVRGLTRTQCWRVLQPRFPDLTERQVSEINARLFGALTPQQRWRLSVRAPSFRRIAVGGQPDDGDDDCDLEEPGAGPDELTEEMQQRRQLRDALAKLPADQRLLLQLRFEQELTLAEVARLVREPDPFRANRRIHAALEALAALMGAAGTGLPRKIR